MMLRARSVLQRLKNEHVAPQSALGSRIKNKPQLMVTLARHARYLTAILLGLFIIQVSLVLAAVVLAASPIFNLHAPLLPYVNGTALLALMEFSRRVTREWFMLALALKVAPHASDSQLADLISDLLTSFKNQDMRKRPASGHRKR